MWHVPGPDWSPVDVQFAAALAAYEGSMCAGCGEAKQIAWHPDMGGWYEVECDVVCAGCGALEEQRANDRQNDVQHSPGTKFRLVNTRPADRPLPAWPSAPQREHHDASDDEHPTQGR